MMEWPSWQDAEFRLGSEWLLATHDAYHWLAGAEGFGLAADHPMADMLKTIADALGAQVANVAFWSPVVLSSCVAVLVFAWVWTLGSMEAGIAAGLLACFSPGFLARTLLGFYDTDLITLFFPLLISLVPATWTMRHMLLPKTVDKTIAQISKEQKAPACAQDDDPLAIHWTVFLALSGLLSWWTQAWHSVFPYIIRYNVLLLAVMACVVGQKGKRAKLLLGTLIFALPTLIGPHGLILPALILCDTRTKLVRRRLAHPLLLTLLWIVAIAFLLQGDIATSISNHINAYLKRAGDVKTSAGASLVYPSVAQSIVEVQDVSIYTLLSYFHPWPEAAFVGLAGFIAVLIRCPAALFLLPLAALAILSMKLGGRMVMFGAPIIGIGLSLPFFWILYLVFRGRVRKAQTGILASVLLTATLVVPFANIIAAMSQGPMINRRHADCLQHVRAMTPNDALLWIWWDWGYAAHHFAKRSTIADGARHAGPSLYLPAAVFATESPRFARQLIRYTESKGNEAGNVLSGLNAQEAQALIDRLHSPQTPLIEGKSRIFIVVSFEMLRLGFWISNFGSWNFESKKGEGGALSIVPQELAYRLDTGEVRLGESENSIDAASISVFKETGITYRNYVQEWLTSHPQAGNEEKQAFLARRRNVHFLFNTVTDEKLAIDERIHRSLMVRLLISGAQDPLLSPYFKLVYDNVFARIYEVL